MKSARLPAAVLTALLFTAVGASTASAAEYSTTPDATSIFVGSGTLVDVMANDNLPSDAMITYVDVPPEAGDLFAAVQGGQVRVFANNGANPGTWSITYGVWSPSDPLFGADGLAETLTVTVGQQLTVPGTAFGSNSLHTQNIADMQPVTTQPAAANVSIDHVEVVSQPSVGTVTANADNSLTWDLSSDITTDAELDALRNRFLSARVRVFSTDGQQQEINTSLHVRTWTQVAFAVTAVDGEGAPVEKVDLMLTGIQDVDASVEQALSIASTTDASGFSWMGYARAGVYRLAVSNVAGLEIQSITVDDTTLDASVVDGEAAIDFRALTSPSEYLDYNVTVVLADPAVVTPPVTPPAVTPAPEPTTPEVTPAPTPEPTATPAPEAAPVLRFETGEFAPSTNVSPVRSGHSAGSWMLLTMLGVASLALAGGFVLIARDRRAGHARTGLLVSAVAVGVGGIALTLVLGLQGAAVSPAEAAPVTPVAVEKSAAPTPATSPTAAPTASPEPTSEPVAETGHEPGPTDRLVIPSVGLDVALKVEAIPSTGTINPASFEDAWEETSGSFYPGQEGNGTLLVAMHASNVHTDAPGNLVSDGKSVAVSKGDQVTVRDETFTVTATYIIPKDQWGRLAEGWQSAEGRLLLVTCLPPADGSGHAENNVVIVGERVTA